MIILTSQIAQCPSLDPGESYFTASWEHNPSWLPSCPNVLNLQLSPKPTTAIHASLPSNGTYIHFRSCVLRGPKPPEILLYDSYTEISPLPGKAMNQFKALVLTFQASRGLTPHYFCSIVQNYRPTWHIRYSTSGPWTCPFWNSKHVWKAWCALCLGSGLKTPHPTSLIQLIKLDKAMVKLSAVYAVTWNKFE